MNSCLIVQVPTVYIDVVYEDSSSTIVLDKAPQNSHFFLSLPNSCYFQLSFLHSSSHRHLKCVISNDHQKLPHYVICHIISSVMVISFSSFTSPWTGVLTLSPAPDRFLLPEHLVVPSQWNQGVKP